MCGLEPNGSGEDGLLRGVCFGGLDLEWLLALRRAGEANIYFVTLLGYRRGGKNQRYGKDGHVAHLATWPAVPSTSVKRELFFFKENDIYFS